MYCKKCGSELDENAKFCSKCGKKYAEKPTTDPKSKAGKKRNIIYGGVTAVVLILVLGTVFYRFVLSERFAKEELRDYGFYLKDGEVYYVDCSGNDPIQVTSHLTERIDEYNENDFKNSFWCALGEWFVFNEERTVLFYPERAYACEDYYSEVDLYRRNIFDKKSEPERIDTDVEDFIVNQDGSQIVYKKKGKWYWSDMNDKVKIASQTTYFDVSEDLQKVLYRTEDHSLFLWNLDGERINVGADIDYLKHVTADFSAIYYQKENDLYRYSLEDDDSEKILEDISSVCKIYDTGEIIYTKRDVIVDNYWNYVEDDLAATDADISEPMYPSLPSYPKSPQYPNWWDYYSDEAYDAALIRYYEELDNYEIECKKCDAEYEQQVEAYSEAYRLYEEKCARDELRETLKTEQMEIVTYALCYYDGSNQFMISDDVQGVDCSSEKSVAAYNLCDRSSIPKIGLSEVESKRDVADWYEKNILKSTWIMVSGESYDMEMEEIELIYNSLSKDGTTLYFFANITEDGKHGDLYKANIMDGQLQTPEFLDDDVVTDLKPFINVNDELVYHKGDWDFSEPYNDIQLYINGEEIDNGFVAEKVDFLVGTKNANLYFSDYYQANGQELLSYNLYKDGKTQRVADDVILAGGILGLENGALLYTSNYEDISNGWTGDLYLYHDGKHTAIDTDISGLLW